MPCAAFAVVGAFTVRHRLQAPRCSTAPDSARLGRLRCAAAPDAAPSLPTTDAASLPTADAAPLPTADAAPLPTADAAPLPASDAAPLPTADAAPLPTAEAAPLPTADAAPLPTAGAAPPPATPARRALQALPTSRERRWLAERRVARPDTAPAYTARATAFVMRVWPLVVLGELSCGGRWVGAEVSGVRRGRKNRGDEEEEERRPVRSTLTEEEAKGVLTWAYVVRVKTSKYTMGKRAVVRNRGQRRIAAALRLVMPEHATRGREYVVSVMPAALVVPFEDLVVEVQKALKATKSWSDVLGEEEMRRPRYLRRRP